MKAGQLAVRLPTEAEWEKAARGPLPSPGSGEGAGVRLWAWGDTWEDGRANTAEIGLGETSPVGMFPDGHSPYDLHDMTGNVWEWTASKWGINVMKPDFGYPYDSKDGREKTDGPDFRVVRGGSFLSDARYVRCAYRGWFLPSYFYVSGGFRMVLSPSAHSG